MDVTIKSGENGILIILPQFKVCAKMYIFWILRAKKNRIRLKFNPNIEYVIFFD